MMLRKSDTLVDNYASDLIHFITSSKEGRCHDGNNHFYAISICGFEVREMVAILLQHAGVISNLFRDLKYVSLKARVGPDVSRYAADTMVR